MFRIWLYWLWDRLFAKLYKVLRLERLGFGRPQSLVQRLMTKDGLNIEPNIHMMDPKKCHPDNVAKHAGINGYAGHNGANGGVSVNGKRKALHQKKKWSEHHQSSLSVPGRDYK